jgi:hypothetical protein
MNQSRVNKGFLIAVTGLYLLALIASLGAIGFLIYDYSYDQCQNSHILAGIDEDISNTEKKLDELNREAAEEPDCLWCGVEGVDMRPDFQVILNSLTEEKIERSSFNLGTYMQEFGYKVIGFAILLALVSTLLFIYLRRKLRKRG